MTHAKRAPLLKIYTHTVSALLLSPTTYHVPLNERAFEAIDTHACAANRCRVGELVHSHKEEK